MSDKSQELAEDRTDYAEDRTDWAEDRTAMANERTFAEWMRTAFAAIGIGIGFNALFDKLEPAWVPKALPRYSSSWGSCSYIWLKLEHVTPLNALRLMLSINQRRSTCEQ